MIARIRKLNEDDLPALKEIDNYNAKILVEELESKEDSSYKAYGIFFDLDVLVGFCSISKAEDYSNYKYYDNDSLAIDEVYLLPDYNKITSLYCDLLDFVLNDKENKDCNIFFNNNINLDESYYTHLGFDIIEDGILVRIKQLNIDKEE